MDGRSPLDAHELVQVGVTSRLRGLPSGLEPHNKACRTLSAYVLEARWKEILTD